MFIPLLENFCWVETGILTFYWQSNSLYDRKKKHLVISFDSPQCIACHLHRYHFTTLHWKHCIFLWLWNHCV